MPDSSDKVAIIAGSGSVPCLVAESAKAEGRAPLLLGIEGSASPDIEAFSHQWVSLIDIESIMEHLHKASLKDVVIVGAIKLPDISDSDLMQQARIPEKLLGLLMEKGGSDNALLSSVIEYLEGEGFRIVAPEEVCTDLTAKEGFLAGNQTTPHEEKDISYALEVIHRLSSLNIGQAAVVRGGVAVAVEAMEGTDAMLKRAVSLLQFKKGQERRGVLVKLPRPHQDMRIDLPTIGPQTVESAAAAGLAGIALMENQALIVHKKETSDLAKKTGLFIRVLSAQS